MKKVFTKSIPDLESSRQLAQKLCEKYLRNESHFTLMLEGGLGVGKTFMVSEILHCLGVQAEATSPTYALVNEYESEETGAQFAHFDFYRLEDQNDFFARGFTDITQDSDISCFVEWPDKISTMAKQTFTGTVYTLKLEFEGADEGRLATLFKH